MTTLFLAESEIHVRAALRLHLEHKPGFEITGEDGTAESALAKICQNPPDAILLDWNLPGLHPQRLIPALRLCAPKTLIVAISIKPEQAKIALNAGVDAFIPKQLAPDQFLDLLRKALIQEGSSNDKN